ncbi:MAG TPA: hypothetical protein DCX32_01720 [Candidatus Moranbacteria bacterium]|nr:MAG: Polysaccharide biosynthesis protein [Parcubacteria group bacterium GW2011_GWC1_45_14]HAV11240.1 hypothetical protein [Candidatus Moranbacteria bacterium]
MSKHFLLKSAFWLTVSEIIYNLSGYIIHSAMGRILGPEDYGRYGLVVTLTTMIIILIGNGIPTAMSKYLSEFFESKPEMVSAIKRQALRLQFFVIGSITVIFFLLSPLLARILGDPSLTELFRISTLIIPTFAAASFYFYYYTGIHKFNLQAILKTFRSIFRVITIVGLAYIFGVEGSIAGYFVAPFAVFLVAYFIDKIWISKKYPASKNASFEWKKLANYAWPVTLFMLFYELFISIDLYLVQGILKDEYLTGIYNGSLTVSRIPYYLFYALTIILLPVISKTTSENNHKETFSIISSALRLMLIMLFPGVILMSIYSSQILTLFYGKAFIEGALAMSILAVGVGFLTIFYVLSFVMNGAGKVMIPMWIAFFGFCVNATFNFILIGKYGILGSAVATTITSFVIMTVMLYFIGKNFAVSIKLNSLLKIIIASTLLMASTLFLPTSVALFLLSSLVALTVYFTSLYLLGEISPADLEMARNLVAKKK